jgi:hypothetical protein
MLRLTLCFILIFVRYADAQTAILKATRDNTLYETKDGSISNGAGSYIFAGSTGANGVRRILLHFDLSSIPQDAKIKSAILSLYMNKSKAGSFQLSVHRLLSDWGEGSSAGDGGEGLGAIATIDDATWLYAFYDKTRWKIPGGDFIVQSSAEEAVIDEGWYEWRSDALIGDVESWIKSPGENFGWVILGDETRSPSAKRFISRNYNDHDFHPRLTVEYSPQSPTPIKNTPWSRIKAKN